MNSHNEKNTVSPPDPNKALGAVSNLGEVLIVLGILLYLGLNIAGSVYCNKLLKLGRANSEQKGGAIASVFIGWFMLPLVNITSIIMYKSMK